MNEFTTVFEIDAAVNGIRADATFRFLIGLTAVAVGLIGLVRQPRETRWIRGNRPPFLFITGWGMLWLLMTMPLLRLAVFDVGELLTAYRRGECQVTEGPVQVKWQQPSTGHSGGDIILVGGHRFEVNYFHVTPGYKQTISHGGALRVGVYARLHFYEDMILKVEVRSQSAR